MNRELQEHFMAVLVELFAMKKLFILILTTYTLSGLAQKLPETYPKYYFTFEEADSIEHQPLYEDWVVRDSLKRNFGRGNRHREALAVEKYELEKQQIDFLERQEQNNRHWNVTLLNGEVLELIPPKYRDAVDYAFEHYYKDLELIVFREQWFEGNGYLIVNRKNGRRSLTLGPPIFSPDRKFFIAMSADLEAEYSPTGIQLFEISNKLILKIDYRMKIGPGRITWISNSSFALEAYSLNWENKPRYQFYHYHVAIKKTEP